MSPWARWSIYGKPRSVEDSLRRPRKKKRFGPAWAIRKSNCFPGPGSVPLALYCRLIWAAIGKGYALDRAAEVLRAHGISRALLDAGGSSMSRWALLPAKPAGWCI